MKDKKDRIKKVLNSDYRYLYLVSLISSDTNYDKESILEHLEMLNDIKSVLDDEDINKVDEVIDFVNAGFEILNRELEDYEE